ncbi:MAG: IS5 family transposase [Panacagrimonas sp.]
MQKSFSDLEYAVKKKQTRRDRFLSEIEIVTPWKALISGLEPHYPKTGRGRPPMGLERMLRMYIAQQCFGLSDEGIEDAIYDSQAIRRFVGIDLGHDAVPDATILNAPSSTKNREGVRDPEMHQTKKGNQYYFGMKAHIGVDAEQGMVHSLVGTAANVSDVTQAHHLLHGQEIYAFGDAGYQGVGKRKEHQGQSVDWHVAMRPGRRKTLDTLPDGPEQEQIEKIKFSIRAVVEHPFHVIKNSFGLRKLRYRGLAKNTAQFFTLFGMANLVIARRRLLSIQGPVASGVWK